jgi:hypothetical protein
VPITKPALGMSADYFLPPTPNTSLPDPKSKSTESFAYSQAGVDTGEIIIRGGSHLDFSWIPNQLFGASLRGADEIAWYTSAWFDKYVKGDPTADARLLTNRWRDDPIEAAIDPNHDGNGFSFYYLSRLDLHRANGTVFDCEDLRDGCPGMTSNDGYPGTYDYVKIDTVPDAVSGSGAPLRSSSGLGACPASRRITFRLRRVEDHRITRVKAYVDGHLVLTRRGHSLRRVTLPGLPGTRRHRIRVWEYSGHRLVRRITRYVYGCAHPR